MRINLEQQNAIREQVAKAAIAPRHVDEIYDHIITKLESRSAEAKFSVIGVSNILEADFDNLINTEAEINRFNFLNTLGGSLVFLISLLVYWLTLEPTVSFWDCGEFIAASSGLQVGHQPGAPVFLMIGKLFSLMALGDTSRIAYWVNFGSALASATTIAFLFWTIILLGKKILGNQKIAKNAIGLLAAAGVGSLAFTFSDTFWFSAVEAEVYAMSTLFTAVTFWAMLKWEKSENDRWLIFIGFLVGLSIGVHLLSLLLIPALALIWYFKKANRSSWWGAAKAFIVGCAVVGIIQVAVIQYFVLLAAKFDLLFVNTLGLGFGSGALFFLGLVGVLLTIAIRYSIRKKLYNLNLGLLSTVFVLFGFSAYFMIIIRANAKPNINLSDPSNPFSLHSYLSRTNYIAAPLLHGNTFDAKVVENEVTGKTYRKGDAKYIQSGERYDTRYDKNMLFPRTYSQKPGHDKFYQRWMNLSDGQTPTFSQNIRFFFSWQLGVMYWRYFFWNFSGRQNDEQGYGGIENGNWITGINKVDNLRLGNQVDLPPSILENAGHNVFYGLPFLLGLAGAIWIFRKHKQLLIVIGAFFLLTGMAIIVYINQDPMQVRERDYAYVGSFYAFAILIGFGVLMMRDLLSRVAPKTAQYIAGIICVGAVPVLMAYQGWDDHNRSEKYTALHWAKNYLDSCAPNAILFTNADNDTYPLWYVQEVENYRTDVRVVCIQFLNDAAFVDQMKTTSGKSAPLPISMANSSYVDGVRDYLPFVDYGIQDSVELGKLMEVMTSDNKADMVEMSDGKWLNFLPTKKLKMSIDANQLVKTGTIKPNQLNKVASTMEWNYNSGYVTRQNLAMLDILSTNNWQRPIYFATSVSSDTYMGLDKYLHLEGYAYRLLPFSHAGDERDKMQKTNSEVMYKNMMQKMDFSGFKQASYLDPESRRVLNATWNLSNMLAANMLQEGNGRAARSLLKKNLEELPVKNASIGDTLSRIQTVGNLFKAGMSKEGDKLALATADFLNLELAYLGGLPASYQEVYRSDIEAALYVLSTLEKITVDNERRSAQQHVRAVMSAVNRYFEV